MSNEQRKNNLVQLIKTVGPRFNELAKIHNAVHFQREASFALEALNNNNYLASVAMSNPDSLKRAVVNVAAVGLSLSPVYKYAYLVPRDKKVCLDISYRGFVQLAVEVGSIKWAVAEIVYENDTFKLRGLGQEPIHEFRPFSKERGDIVGGYCVAKTHDNEYIVTHMTIDKVFSIRDRSVAWRAYMKDNSKKNPWVTDEDEMIKKTLIKNGYKSWPMTDTSKRLDQAVDVTNTVDEMDFSTPPEETAERPEKIDQVLELLKKLDREEDAFVEHLTRVHKREIKQISDLTPIELDQAISMLSQFAGKKESVNENAG